MTRKELSEYLGYETICEVSSAVAKAKRLRPDLFQGDKIGTSSQSLSIETDFNGEEVAFICENLKNPPSPFQIELIRNNIKEPEKRYQTKKTPYIKGMKKFINACKKNPKKKACGNCAYCIPSTRRNEDSYHKVPFCSFYNRFLYYTYLDKRGKQVQVDIFNDWCETWTRGEIKLWYINKYRDIGGNNAAVCKKNDD